MTTRAGTVDTAGDRATPKRPRYRAPDTATKRSTLQVRVGPEDLARLDAIAEALKLTRSGAVRRAVTCLTYELERFRYVTFKSAEDT